MCSFINLIRLIHGSAIFDF